MNEEILKRFKVYDDNEAIRKFFELLRKIIAELNLSAENKRLAIDLVDEHKRIAVNINGRLVLALQKEKGKTFFSFMVHRVDEEAIEKTFNILHKGVFKEVITPADLIKISKEEVLQKDISIVLDCCLKACREYLPLQEMSQYRRHHVSELYEIAKDENLLTEYLKASVDFKPSEINYWVFQANPKVYNVVDALKNNVVESWRVSQYKNEIKEGDKIILWITGENAGVYALATATSNVGYISDTQEELKYYVDSIWLEGKEGVKMKIDYNLANKPLSKSTILNIDGLADLKQGTQGTNFPATKKQYKTLLRIMDNNKTSKINYKEAYIKWLNKNRDNDGGMKNSYLRAIDILSEIVGYNIFEENNLEMLAFLYKDLLKEQKIDGGKYYNKDAPSYGNKGFYSAAINTYSDFLKDYLSNLSKVQPSTFLGPLNQILYGPPGTGKTYNSIDKAVEIVTGSSSSDHSENKKQFDELRKQGQIEFVTFHQNYSYEDFMVGIRPDITEGAEGLKFKRQTGIFYEISKRARENYTNSLKDATTISYENWVKNMLDEFKDYVETIIEKEGKFTIKNAVSIYGVEDDAFIYTGEKSDGEKWKNERLGMHYAPLITVFLNEVKDRKDIKSLENIPSLERQHATYVLQVIQLFREFLKKNKKEFSKEEVASERLKKYVLVIDEINRANISKVFGELITLLEDDKRLGEPNELKITLPNGEKEFGVPPNLYIIGTMNTADKSIALIDIALRRRFEFVGYYPIYEGYDAAAIKLLKKINETIYEKKKSADYLIGHAYFMKNQSIETVLKNKVLPLLMEYFSGKTEIVSSVFNDTDWSVNFNTSNYSWDISSK